MAKPILSFIFMFFITCHSAWGLPLWDSSPFKIDGYTYTVYNRYNSDLDTFSDYYSGYFSADFSGYYLGTIAGNTDKGTYHPLETIIKYYYQQLTSDNFVISDIYKVDNIKKTDPDLSGSSGPLTVTWNKNLKSGKWYFEPSSDLGFGFYAVKGGPEFALYYVDPTRQEGVWTTRHLLTKSDKIPGISHFSGAPTEYDSGDPGPTPQPVPEPSMLMMLGAGLLGLGWATRCRRC